MGNTSNTSCDDGDRHSGQDRLEAEIDASAFEDSLHKAAVLDGIVSGVLPLKFAYAGSGARAHDALAQSMSYRNVVGSERLEATTLRKMDIPPAAMRQIVDVGPGNGQHTIAFLSELVSIGYKCERYLGLDFSLALLEIALPRLDEALGGEPSIAVGRWDIEQEITHQIEDWRIGDEPVLTCSLGHTLGNVEDPSIVLANLWRSLRQGDLLLLGLAPHRTGLSAETYLAPYRTDVFRRAALEPLRAAGIDLRNVDFRLRYENEAVIADAIIRVPSTVDGVTLEPGHVVRCFLSRRINPQAIADLLEEDGWIARSPELDESGDHLTIVAVRW